VTNLHQQISIIRSISLSSREAFTRDLILLVLLPLSFLSRSVSKKEEPGYEVSKNRFFQPTAVSVSYPSGSFPAKRALRPGMIFASPASRDELAGLASADDLWRLASYVL